MSKKLLLFPFGGNAREALLSVFAVNEKRNEWETILYGYVDQLPVDSNYNITVEEIIDVLTLDQTNKDKLLLVWGIIEPTLEAIKLRTEPSS